jgi:hypothetical protein
MIQPTRPVVCSPRGGDTRPRCVSSSEQSSQERRRLRLQWPQRFSSPQNERRKGGEVPLPPSCRPLPVAWHRQPLLSLCNSTSRPGTLATPAADVFPLPAGGGSDGPLHSGLIRSARARSTLPGRSLWSGDLAVTYCVEVNQDRSAINDANRTFIANATVP